MGLLNHLGQIWNHISLINGFCSPEIAEAFTGLFTPDIGGNRLCDIAMVRIGED